MTENNELLVADVMSAMAQTMGGILEIMSTIAELSNPENKVSDGTQEMIRMFFEKCQMESLTHKNIDKRLLEITSVLDQINDVPPTPEEAIGMKVK